MGRAGAPSSQPDGAREEAGSTVLLVEDEAIVRKSIARQLRHLGFEVTAVGSGEEALAAMAAAVPAVILTDLSMPGMDGVALATRVRAEAPEVPIILMSGLVPEELLPQLETLSVVQLDKPFGENELKDAMARAAAVDRLRR